MLQAVTQRVMDMRELLPGVNVSKLLSQYPHLVLRLEPGRVSQQLHVLRSVFGTAHAEMALLLNSGE